MSASDPPVAVDGPTSVAAANGVELVTTLSRLDEKLAEIDTAAKISDDAARAVFGSFRMDFSFGSELDPWSDDYRSAQFDLYLHITSRSEYSTSNEISGYSVDPRMPFPYYTQSSATVGDQLIAIGFMIKTMALPSGSSLLEFGPGWGNSTIALAQMGYDVTALDIDPNFARLINDRAELFGLNVDSRVGEFSDAASIQTQYDAVLFYECFHHCSDHVQLLKDLHRVVKPGGHVFLCAEPILESFHAPWGVRLDGESLWAARQNGWLELGFTESYFVETCARHGWSVTRFSSDVSPLAIIWRLSQFDGSILPGQTRLPLADERGWAAPDSPDSTQRYTTSRSRLVCPVTGPWTSVSIDLVNPGPLSLPFVIRHGREALRGEMKSQSTLTLTCPYDGQAGEIIFETQSWQPSVSIRGSSDSREIGIGVIRVDFR